VVIDDDNLVRDSVEFELQVEVADGRGDAAFLIPRGDDDGEEL
jgi:hypothetical protein